MKTLPSVLFLLLGLLLPLVATPTPALAGDEPWKFEGDLRYRHDTLGVGDEDLNHRHRIRARFGVLNLLRDDLTLGLRIATASDNGDPVTANQTLSPAFTKKPLMLDLAFFDCRPVKGLSVLGGKMKNPFHRPADSQMVWDSDLTPEGLGVTYSRQHTRVKWFVTGGAFWTMDRRDGEPDAHLLAGQAGVGLKLGGDFLLVAAGAYYDYTALEGYGPLFDDEPFGNTVDATGLYEHDYNLVDAGLELHGKVGKLPFSVFGQVVTNLAVSDENTAFSAGFTLGKLGGPRTWRLRYDYRQVRRDAVFGTFSDSDFGGGGTGTKGHLLVADFALTDHLGFGLTLFLTVIDDADQTRYDRVQLDLNVKF